MTHIKDGVSEGVEQIVADHDPNGLHRLAAIGHRKQQNAGDGQQRGRQQQPGPGLALRRMGAVNDVAHDYIGDGIDNLGGNGEDYQEGPAPDMGQLQYVRVIDV